MCVVKNICRALTSYGFGVLRFDFTGLGRSEGEFADSHFSPNVNDFIAVHEYISKHHEAPSLLAGHSLGGGSVLAVASKIDAVKAVVTVDAPATISHVKHLFLHNFEILKDGNDVFYRKLN